MWYRLRGQIHWRLFLLKFRWGYVASFVGLLLGLVVIVVEPPATYLGIILTVLSTLLGLALFWKSLAEIRKVAMDFYSVDVNLDRLKALQLSDTYQGAGYQFVDFQGMRAMYSSKVNELLNDNPLPVKEKPEQFSLTGSAHDLAPFVMRERYKSSSILFNDEKVRLVTDLTAQHLAVRGAVELQKTDYFSAVCSNYLTLKEIWSRSKRQLLLDGLRMLANNNIICDLSASGNANQIGISTLAFAADGTMIVLIQGVGNLVSVNKLAPSGSGSADYSDLHHQDYFQDFIRRAMNRELLEECGLKEGEQLVKTRLIGFARLVHQGGCPEFFGVSFLNAPYNSLRVSKAEEPFVADILETRMNRLEIPVLMKELRKYRQGNQHRFSFQLYLNIRFLEEYLERNPQSFLELIGSQSPNDELP